MIFVSFCIRFFSQTWIGKATKEKVHNLHVRGIIQTNVFIIVEGKVDGSYHTYLSSTTYFIGAKKVNFSVTLI
jgi:hypothetical protein